MHPSLSIVLARLERSRATLRDAVARVPPQLRDQPPASDRWSVAGVLEHLALVDERSIGALGSKIAEVRATLPPEEGDPALLPSNLEAMLTDRTERRQAPAPLHPSGLRCDEAWARAEASRATFVDLLTAADGLALSRVIHEHQRFGALNVYQWAGFLAAHESRHAEQLLEIASQLDRDPAGATPHA